MKILSRYRYQVLVVPWPWHSTRRYQFGGEQRHARRNDRIRSGTPTANWHQAAVEHLQPLRSSQVNLLQHSNSCQLLTLKFGWWIHAGLIGIKLETICWLNGFNSCRYANGAATNPDAHVVAYAAAQVKKGLDVAKKLGAQNFVFWGGREGYNSLLNTNLNHELNSLAQFYRMALSNCCYLTTT